MASAGALTLFAACTLAGPEPTPAPPDLPPPSMGRPPAGAPPPAIREAPAPPPPAAAPALDPVEGSGLQPPVRALWVVRTALIHPDSVRAVVDRAESAGFNTLLVQVRGRGDAWYRSSHEPRAAPLGGGDPAFDPLRMILEEARPRGIEVHAWINAHLVAGAAWLPPDPLHIIHRRPEFLAVPRELASALFRVDPRHPSFVQVLVEHASRNPERVEGLYASPVVPGAVEHLAAVAAELVLGYDLDGLHLDYLRLPGREYDHGRTALESFRARERALRPTPETRRAEEGWAAGDVFAYVEAFPTAWRDFLREGVTETLERVRGEVRRVRPGLPVSAAVFPDPIDAREHRFQDWPSWVERGLLEAVALMSYEPSDARFALALEAAAAAGGGERVWAGIGTWLNDFEGAVRKGRHAAGAGAGGIVLFSYDWAVGPEGAALAGGDYLGRFGREVFSPLARLEGSRP